MKTISQNQFVDYMSEALPELMSAILREDTSAVSKGQVSLPQFWALHYIARQGGLTVNALATALHRGKSTVSSLLQRLEKNGLVRRERSSADQRVVHVFLTPKGERLMEQIVAGRKEGIRKTYSVLSDIERSRHAKVFGRILANLGKPAALLLALAIPLAAQAQESTNSYSLAESVRIGLQRSVAVANAARQREIAATTQQRALSGALPKVTGLADYSLFDPQNLTESGTTTVGAEASWEIYSGGRTLSAIRAAKAYKQLTAWQERRIREDQVRNIALGYYQVQLARTQVGVLELSVKQLEDFEAETRKKHEAGAVSEFDWLSAKVALANERPRLIAAKNDLALAVERFRNLTYIDDAAFTLSEPLAYAPVEIDLDAAIATGLGKRPDLLEKSSAIELRQEDIKQQKSAYQPKLSLFAGYNYYNPDPYSFLPGSTADGWQDHWNTGIRATWSLFDGGERRANLGESKLNMAIEEDEYRDLGRDVALNIRTQWLRGRDAAEVIDATTENVGLAERALQIARARFAAGLSTNLEVTQANLELGDARLARSRALYEYNVAATGMKHAMGTLLEEYGQ